MQFNQKEYYLGQYAVEADAAAAREVVAKVLGSRLNFKEPQEITGQRSDRADELVADAVKAAKAFVRGKFPTLASLGKYVAKFLTVTLSCPDDPKLKAQAMAAMKAMKMLTTPGLALHHRRSGQCRRVLTRARWQRRARPLRPRVRYVVVGIPPV